MLIKLEDIRDWLCGDAGDAVRCAIQEDLSSPDSQLQKFLDWLMDREKGADPALWVRHNWNGLLRERWLEHLRGRAFWSELDLTDFGLLQRTFQNSDLIDEVIQRLKVGQENLDILLWAIDEHLHIYDIISILECIYINSILIEMELVHRLEMKREDRLVHRLEMKREDRDELAQFLASCGEPGQWTAQSVRQLDLPDVGAPMTGSQKGGPIESMESEDRGEVTERR